MKVFFNFLYLLISKGTGLILFTLVTPLLIKKIGLDGLGQVSIVIAFAFIFDSFVEYAFSITIVKDIAANKNDKNFVSNIFCQTLCSKLFLFIIGCVFSTFLIVINKTYYDIKELFLMSFIFVLARAIMPIWYFLGVEKMQAITIVSILSKFTYLISIYCFIKTKNDIFKVIFFWSLSEFIPSIIMLLFIIFRDKIAFNKPTFGQVFSLLKRDFIFSLSLFFFRIYTYLPVLILGQVCSDFFVGIYSIADKIVAIIKDTIGLLFNSILPRVSNIYVDSVHKAKTYFIKIMTVFTVLFFIGLLIMNIFSYKIISFFTTEYVDDVEKVLFILSISSVFILVRIPSSVFIVIKRLDRLFTFSIIFCTIICIFTSYFLAIKFQEVGVSYAILLTEFLLFAVLFVGTFNKIKSELDAK